MAVGGAWTIGLYQSAFFDKLTVKKYHLKTPKWPSDFPPLKITFLTDLHVGCRSVGEKELEKIVTQVNALDSDIILLGGDYLTSTIKRFYRNYVLPQPIAETLKPLKAPLGVYSILGNHDWACDGDAMWQALDRIGIKMLENESVFIPFGKDGFWLIGLADYLSRLPDYKKAVAKISDNKPQIVLSHDPITFADLPEKPVIQLSGHTHGGQVLLPFIGSVVNPTPGSPLRWNYGLIEEKGRTMIVSSGVGTSILPIKNTPCEVVCLTISSLESEA